MELSGGFWILDSGRGWRAEGGGRGLSSAKHSFSVIGPMALRVTPTPPTAGGSGCCQQKSGNKNCKLFGQKRRRRKPTTTSTRQHRQLHLYMYTVIYIYFLVGQKFYILWQASHARRRQTGRRTDRQPTFERHLQFTEMDSEHSSWSWGQDWSLVGR